MLIVSFFIFYLPQKRFENIYNEKGANKEQDISYEKEGSFEAPQLAIISGTVVEVKEDIILIDMEDSYDINNKRVEIKISKEAEKNISKTRTLTDEKALLNESEEQIISLEQIQEGDSISFLLEEMISVVDFSKKDMSLSASRIFVGPPANEMRE
jgi:hypothetical protein